MSDLLSTGASGLRAYSRALATVGDNIANAQTPGYARRTLALRDGQGVSNSALLRPHVRPGGVEIAGIRRATDEWLQTEARLASGDGERTRLQVAALGQVEAALADSQNGIAAGLSALFATADRLTADPSSTTLRAQFLGAADSIAAGFRGVANRLDGLAEANRSAATAEVSRLNDDLAALDKINIGLRKARPGSTGEAGLLDERDRLLDSVAGRIDVAISFGNHGTATVRAAGSGEPLVEQAGPNRVEAVVAGNGRVGFTIGGQPVSVASGSLAGLAAASNHIADQRNAVDQRAAAIADQLNAAHQAGLDVTGAGGGPLFNGTSSAATLTSAQSMPHAVAAATASGDNRNMLAFASLRGAGGPEALWAETVTRQVQATASGRAQESAAAIRAENASAARDSVSEIDLDTEAADLIRYQQAYTAAAQTIQIARETMQALLNLI